MKILNKLKDDLASAKEELAQKKNVATKVALLTWVVTDLSMIIYQQGNTSLTDKEICNWINKVIESKNKEIEFYSNDESIAQNARTSIIARAKKEIQILEGYLTK